TSAMEFSSSQLDSIVWLPDGEGRASLALTNITPNELNATITTNQQKDKEIKTVTLGSHEMQVIDLKEILDNKRETAGAALVRVQHDGVPGALIATGFVLNERTGFSSNFAFVDRATAKSNHVSGAHVRFGPADVSEGFPQGTTFRAPLVIANAGDDPTEARVAVDYTIGSEAKRIELARISLAPQTLKQIDLSTEMSRRGVTGPVENAGVDIDYTGKP